MHTQSPSDSAPSPPDETLAVAYNTSLHRLSLCVESKHPAKTHLQRFPFAIVILLRQPTLPDPRRAMSASITDRPKSVQDLVARDLWLAESTVKHSQVIQTGIYVGLPPSKHPFDLGGGVRCELGCLGHSLRLCSSVTFLGTCGK
jgi:hypothetical protein